MTEAIERDGAETIEILAKMPNASCRGVVACMRRLTPERDARTLEAVVEALISIEERTHGEDRVSEAIDGHTGCDAICWCAKLGSGSGVRALARRTSKATVDALETTRASAVMCACIGASRALTPTQLSKASGSSVGRAWADDAEVVRRTRERYADALVAALECRSEEVNERAPNGWTPLTFACRHAEVLGTEMIEFLLNAGAEVNLPDARGTTALAHAASADSLEVCRLLRDAGADASVRDARGFTPAMTAAFRNPGNVKLLAALAIDSH